MSNISVSLVTGATGLGLVALSTTPSVLALASNIVHSKKCGKPANGIYRDKDGVSTEKDTAAFSTTIPKFIIALFAISGAAVSTTSAVLTALHGPKVVFIDNWLNAVAWVRFFIFVLFLFLFKLIKGKLLLFRVVEHGEIFD